MDCYQFPPFNDYNHFCATVENVKNNKFIEQTVSRETTSVILARVRPSLLSPCDPWLWLCSQTFHSFLLTKLSSITKPLRSGFSVRSLDNDRKHYEKTNVHICGILPWIMWHITIPNWFKWSFFFLREEPNRISVCRTTKTGHGGATWWRHLSHYG